MSKCFYFPVIIHFLNIQAFCHSVSSPGAGNDLVLPGEYGGQGAQEDPHAATLHGEIFTGARSKHTTLCAAKLLST